MPGPPLRPDQHRKALIEAANAEGFDVELGGAQFRVGWENVVLDTTDGWILRFPRDEGPEYGRELAILDRLDGRLPAPIPKVLITGKRRDFAGYRRLDGVHLSVAEFEKAEPRVRDRIAASLAGFLAAMHSALRPEEIVELGIPQFTDSEFYQEDDTALAAELRPRLAALRAEEQSLRQAGRNRPVLLHNDFHLGNLVLDDPLGRVAGVWDFSCVAVGDPSLDFRYLVGDSADLAQRIASAYAARTGIEVDLGLASAALRLEEVSDAIVEGRDPTPYL